MWGGYGCLLCFVYCVCVGGGIGVRIGEEEGGMGCSVVCTWCLASSHAEIYIHSHTHILSSFHSFCTARRDA